MNDDFWSLTPVGQREIINHLYHSEEKSLRDIAKELGTYPSKINKLAKTLGIEIRSKAEDQRLALSKGKVKHPTEGTKRSDSTKKKISEKQGKVWDNLSQKQLEERSKIGQESWNKKTPTQKSDFFKKGSEAFQHAARNGSKIERYLVESLINDNYAAVRHSKHIVENEKFHIDIYIPDLLIAVEVDGPTHFKPIYGEEKLRKRQVSDMSKNGLILSAGMVLVRVKLSKRISQRYLRHLYSELKNLIKKIETRFPEKDERYYEI